MSEPKITNGGKHLEYDGAGYTHDGKHKRTDYWKCSKGGGCKGRVIQKDSVFELKHPHTKCTHGRNFMDDEERNGSQLFSMLFVDQETRVTVHGCSAKRSAERSPKIVSATLPLPQATARPPLPQAAARPPLSQAAAPSGNVGTPRHDNELSTAAASGSNNFDEITHYDVVGPSMEPTNDCVKLELTTERSSFGGFTPKFTVQSKAAVIRHTYQPDLMEWVAINNPNPSVCSVSALLEVNPGDKVVVRKFDMDVWTSYGPFDLPMIQSFEAKILLVMINNEKLFFVSTDDAAYSSILERVVERRFIVIEANMDITNADLEVDDSIRAALDGGIDEQLEDEVEDSFVV